MENMLLANGIGWLVMGLIWSKSDGLNLALKVALFGFGLWTVLVSRGVL